MEFKKRGEDEAYGEEERRRSLEYFEGRRQEIVGKLVQKLGIPAHEFEPGNDTAFFHFLTSALAVGSWLADTCGQAFEDRLNDGPPEMSDEARQKLVASALVRLALLPSAFGFDEGDGDGEAKGRMDTAHAFMSASGRGDLCSTFVLMSWSTIREFLVFMARSWASGEERAPKREFFSWFEEWSGNVDKDRFIPHLATVEACAMLYSEFTFVDKRIEAFGTRRLSPDAPDWKAFSVAKDFLLPCAYRRHPVVFDGTSFSQDGASFADAARSMGKGDDPSLALFETVLVDEEAGPVIGLFMDPYGERTMLDRAIKGAAGAGLKPMVVSFALA